MSTNAFMRAMTFTKKWEGGWSNDAADSGGKTMFGITERVYKAHYPEKWIKDCTMDEALGIYKKDYWDAAGCADLPLPLAVAVFDTAVNCGVSRAKRWLKEAQDPKGFLERRRQHYYTIIENNPALAKFKKGWLNRLNDLHKFVDILAAEEGNP